MRIGFCRLPGNWFSISLQKGRMIFLVAFGSKESLLVGTTIGMQCFFLHVQKFFAQFLFELGWGVFAGVAKFMANHGIVLVIVFGMIVRFCWILIVICSIKETLILIGIVGRRLWNLLGLD